MNNKEKLIKVIDKDLNKNNNLDIINKKINKSYIFNNVLKYAFVPSLVLIFSIVFSFSINKKDKHLEENRNNISDTNINTSQNTFNNEIYKENDEFDSLPESDYSTEEEICKVVKYVEIKGINEYDFYKNLNIGTEYNSFKMYEVYIKENEKDTKFSKLNNYIISYKVKKKDEEFKEIEIAFSKENEIVSNCDFDNSNEKVSKINDINVTIYMSDNIYVVVFRYDNINFNIRTFNVKEKELINLLKSIIK